MLARLGELLREENSSSRSASVTAHSSVLVVPPPAMLASLTVLAAVITLAITHDTLPHMRPPLPEMPAPGLVWDLASTVTTMVSAEEVE